VIFDFDGTLVASRSADEAAVADLVGADPDSLSGAAVFWRHDGEPLVTRIELAWPGRVTEILPLFERQGPPTRFPGIDRLLEGLALAGRALAVVSSRRRTALEDGLGATGLRDLFQVVVGLDDVREPKPSPEGLLLALRRLGVDRSEAVYVGDNETDVEAGRRAGVTVWKAVWGLPPHQPVTGGSNGTVLLRWPEEVRERLEGTAGG
jgi:phosphoglycolate phosphatase-like HAD superfamily hydrolase